MPAAGRYFVSILVEDAITPLPPVAAPVGLDLGVPTAVVLDSGEKVGNPTYFKQDEKRLATAQRRRAQRRRAQRRRAQRPETPRLAEPRPGAPGGRAP
jgi:putative transposase